MNKTFFEELIAEHELCKNIYKFITSRPFYPKTNKRLYVQIIKKYKFKYTISVGIEYEKERVQLFSFRTTLHTYAPDTNILLENPALQLKLQLLT